MSKLRFNSGYGIFSNSECNNNFFIFMNFTLFIMYFLSDIDTKIYIRIKMVK